ncbi:hypothetical protein D3C73_1001410 [compost metagenome]
MVHGRAHTNGNSKRCSSHCLLYQPAQSFEVHIFLQNQRVMEPFCSAGLNLFLCTIPLNRRLQHVLDFGFGSVTVAVQLPGHIIRLQQGRVQSGTAPMNPDTLKQRQHLGFIRLSVQQLHEQLSAQQRF